MILLDFPKDLIKLDVETCGYGYYDEKEIKLYVETVGYKEKGRGVCNNSTSHPIIWHTHPIGYPWHYSSEDIIRTFQTKEKENYIHSTSTSLIFTEKGIWELFAERTFDLDINWYRYFLDSLNILNKDFEQGRIDFIPYIEKTMYIVNNPKLGNFFRIYWTEWEDNIYHLQGIYSIKGSFFNIDKEIYLITDKKLEKQLEKEGKIKLNLNLKL